MGDRHDIEAWLKKYARKDYRNGACAGTPTTFQDQGCRFTLRVRDKIKGAYELLELPQGKQYQTVILPVSKSPNGEKWYNINNSTTLKSLCCGFLVCTARYAYKSNDNVEDRKEWNKAQRAENHLRKDREPFEIVVEQLAESVKGLKDLTGFFYAGNLEIDECKAIYKSFKVEYFYYRNAEHEIERYVSDYTLFYFIQFYSLLIYYTYLYYLTLAFDRYPYFRA